MSTMTMQPRRVTHRALPTYASLVRSEWVKFWSLPAMWACLLGIVVIGLGTSLFAGFTVADGLPPADSRFQSTIADLTAGQVTISQILAGIVGVMCIGAEYTSGTIQSTLLASPDRVRPMLAKATVVFGIITATGLITAFTSWATTYGLYDVYDLSVGLGESGVTGALVGSAVYIGLCAVFGLGLGAIVRSTTVGSIAVVFFTVVGPILSGFIPPSPVQQLIRITFIGHAGDSMARVGYDDAPFLSVWGGYISPAGGYVIALAWAVIALVAGILTLRKRDA